MLSRRRILWLGAAVLAASALTACTVSLSGGLAGIVSTLALLGLLFGLGATQSGCSDDSGKTDVGPCLTMPVPDASVEVGPCLDPAVDIGPCLSMVPPEAGVELGPCLTPVPPDAGAGLTPDPPPGPAEPLDSLDGNRGDDRATAIARLADRLPADVVARLPRGRS